MTNLSGWSIRLLEGLNDRELAVLAKRFEDDPVVVKKIEGILLARRSRDLPPR